MKLFTLFLVLILCLGASGQQQSSTADSPVLRPPFTVKLRIDKDHSYEQQFDKIPYVADNKVYLFAGDKLGVNVTVISDIATLIYEPNVKKADIQFEFRQEKRKGGKGMMLLLVQNKLDRRLSYGAMMTLPERAEPVKTTVLPVEAHLATFESWPRPIVQLVLSDFHLSQGSATQRVSSK